MVRIFTKTVLILMLCIANSSMAKEDNAKQQLSGPSIQNGATVSVQDPRYSEMTVGNFLFTNTKVISEVMLLINLKTAAPTAAFSTTVSLNIEYDEWANGQFITKTVPVTLQVNYTLEGVFKDKAIFRLKDAHRMRITVNSVSGPVSSLVLQGSFAATRFDAFNVSASTVASISSEFKEQRNELVVSWNAIAGAEEYDLEWTLVNDYSTSGGTRNPQHITIDNNLFRLNSTRVTIINNEYAIPLLYDRGYIVYRVRAIGRVGPTAVPITGLWSFEPANQQTMTDVPHKFLFHGHQNNLNWQASVNFAEEGKNKAAISYYDGSLRNRQAVTRVNSEDKIIVGETIYDFEGRPVVQVLPVPANTSRIGYQRSFNLNMSQKPYSKADFDRDFIECLISIPGMSTTAGASNYYSPANPDKAGHQAYLPDAKLYPFTQTEYTPDNTGRVRRQAGVGETHKLGSSHETKYYYGKPSQEELDKLFASDAGYAKHYKKNMVVDANGQISISYLDAQGKVIGTSLAGSTPENVIDISKPEDVVTTTVDLLGKLRTTDKSGTEDKFAPDAKSRILSKELLVSQNGAYNFDYSVQLGTFLQQCLIGTAQPLCYGCVADIALSLRDECGNEVIPFIGENSISKQVGAVELECSTTGPAYTNQFQTLSALTPGNYSLTRKITINEAALDAYTDDYLARQNDCLLTFDHFLEEEAKNVQIVDCEADCQTCRDAVGPYSKYSGASCNPCLTLEEYNNLMGECDFLCDDEVVQCSNAYNMMLADVSPFGQYGEVMTSIKFNESGAVEIPEGDQTTDPSKFPLSVFNIHNKLPKNKGGTGHWKFPKNGAYLSEDGAPATVDIMALESETGTLTFSPTVEEDAIPAGVKHGDVFQVPPHKLVEVKDFLAAWDPAWAEQLVQLHPEFGYYNFCTILESSHRWDAEWLATDNYLDAVEKGYLPAGVLKPNPMSTTGAISDPYWTDVKIYLQTQVSSRWTSYNTKESEAMARSLNAYSQNFDLWNVVHRTVNCPYDDSQSNICNICPPYDGINTDAEWNTFKSMYFSLKQQFIERKTSIYAIGNDCYNGCIGTQYYSPFSFSFYKHGVFDFITTLSLLTDSDQPCNWRSWNSGIYSEKSKRFPLSTDMINVSEMDFEACYTGFDEDTPNQTLTPDQQVACSNSLRDLVEETKLDSEIGFFESCGQCPIVFDLQSLIDAIAKRKELEKDNVQLSCYPASNYPEFNPDIKKALEEVIPGDGVWYWDKVSSASGELIVNLTKNNGTGNCEMRLKILDPTVTFSSLEGICCLNHTFQPSHYPLTGNGNFIMRGSVAGRSEKVMIEGLVSCMDLASCPFPPKCAPTTEATELQTLMNALLFDFNLGGTSDDLFAATPVKLYEAPYAGIVENTLQPVRQALGNNLTWRSTIVGNILTGYIENNAGGQCLVELRPETNIPFDVTKIVGFSNIRADRDHPDDPTRNFLITAIVETNQGKVRIKLTGYSSCFPISACVPVTNE